ncbi:unnamed protein product [Urochloa decumbens]|uniref:Aminotransferase-like plant mobile domain-containing protein n=1 Tax=Urochloa decumbens TaxID=240449 RepID=A0ABC8ZKU1_9POAL
MGLGGLLQMRPKMHHSRHLIFWLLKNLDTSSMRIALPRNTIVELTEASVERVLGISSSGRPLIDGGKYLSKLVKSQLCRAFRNKDAAVVPTVRDAKRILARSYTNGMSQVQRDTFMMAVAALCCAYMLGPMERSAKIPQGIWHFISNPDNLRHCNWAAYVLYVIKQAAMHVQSNIIVHPTSIRLGGCWLYLELLYLDMVDLGQYNTELVVVPRVTAYSMYKVKDLITMDEIDRKTFGARPVIHITRIKVTCTMYSRFRSLLLVRNCSGGIVRKFLWDLAH